MSDDFSDEDRDACAREAAAAIEAVLDRRCPEIRSAFWSAVEKLYRRDVEAGRRPPALLRLNAYDKPPVRS